MGGVNLAHTGFFLLSTHKSLQVTPWTRVRDLIKGILLYGSVNWSRASDGLKPPKLSPHERKVAMPAKNLDVIKPRENPQAALIKATPKTSQPIKPFDVTAGAIVSDPLVPSDGLPVLPKRFHAAPPSEHELTTKPLEEEASVAGPDETIVVRRRRRHHRHGQLTRRAPRSIFQFGDTPKPGLIARLFGSK